MTFCTGRGISWIKAQILDQRRRKEESLESSIHSYLLFDVLIQHIVFYYIILMICQRLKMPPEVDSNVSRYLPNTIYHVPYKKIDKGGDRAQNIRHIFLPGTAQFGIRALTCFWEIHVPPFEIAPTMINKFDFRWKYWMSLRQIQRSLSRKLRRMFEDLSQFLMNFCMRHAI